MYMVHAAVLLSMWDGIRPFFRLQLILRAICYKINNTTIKKWQPKRR